MQLLIFVGGGNYNRGKIKQVITVNDCFGIFQTQKHLF